MAQLVEEGHLWDGRASLRPGDFVLHVERTRREEGAAAPVRVMTVHQSKGLEFDVVVLPDLGQTMVNDRGTDPIKVRDSKGNIEYVYPAMDAPTRALFPEVEAAFQRDREDRVLDALSLLYVAMTRARYALHLLVPADGKRRSTAQSAANLLRAELAPEAEAVEGDTLFEAGHADWWNRVDTPLQERMRTGRLGDRGDEPEAPLRLRAARGRRRNLPRRTPSGMEGGGALDLERYLRVGPSPGMEFGTLVHAWCEEIEWLEDDGPEEATLLAIASRLAPTLNTAQVAKAAKAFPEWLAPPGIGEVFRRPPPDGTGHRVTVERELPFLVSLDAEILRGTIDRLALTWEKGRVVEAWVVDFKTDRIDPEVGSTVEGLTDFYRPQLEAYGRAVEVLYHLPPEAVRLSLAFLSSGDRMDL
jgi:ATP-dependent exoDNAse (exonuclease V) beta subunit